jgi:hypothetical protein
MASFDRVKVGQVLYSVVRQKMGNTTISRDAVFQVVVKEINTAKRAVFASWNCNTPQWFSERSVNRWKVKEPKRKPLHG